MNVKNTAGQAEKGNPQLGSGSPSPCLHTDELGESLSSAGFERLQKEPLKAFAAFQASEGLGPARSLKLVAKELNMSLSSIREWSAKHRWQARLAQRSAHLAGVERHEAETLMKATAADWFRRQEEQRELE